LRRTRLQASKAKRYQEYLNRLREVKVALSLEEYHRLTGQLDEVNRQLKSLRASLAARTDQDTQREANLQALEDAVAEAETAAQKAEAALSDAKDRLSQEDTTHSVAQEKADALDKEI